MGKVGPGLVVPFLVGEGTVEPPTPGQTTPPTYLTFGFRGATLALAPHSTVAALKAVSTTATLKGG